MNVTLRPESQQWINELVRDGRYRSAEEVLEAALARLRMDPVDQFDEQDWQAIREAEADIAQGRVRKFSEVAAELRRKHFGT